MKVSLYNEPFPLLVIDDFYDKNELQLINSELSKLHSDIKDNPLKVVMVYHLTYLVLVAVLVAVAVLKEHQVEELIILVQVEVLVVVMVLLVMMEDQETMAEMHLHLVVVEVAQDHLVLAD